MTEKSFARFERSERVDQPDLQHGVEGGLVDALGQLVEELIVGEDGHPVVIRGFNVTIADPIITVTRGAAVTGFRHRGKLYRGMVMAGGPASRSYNVSTRPDGTYGVYVRLSLRDSIVRSRRLWDAGAVPPAEVTRLLATRIVEDWDLVLERGSPGPEYVQLGSVPITGGSLGAYTNAISRLFDSAKTTRVLDDSDFGSTADRDETDTIGIRGLVRWTKMVMRQLQDIIGADFFGSDPQGGDANGNGARSLTQLNNEKLARNGSQTMTGNLTVGGSAQISGALTADSSATVGGTLSVAGNITGDTDVNVGNNLNVTNRATITKRLRFDADLVRFGQKSDTLSATENDYVPPADASVLRLTAAAGGSTITGIVAPALSGAQVLLVNVGNDNIILDGENTGSATSNRLLIGAGGTQNITLQENDTAELWYDPVNTRWRVVAAMQL